MFMPTSPALLEAMKRSPSAPNRSRDKFSQTTQPSAPMYGGLEPSPQIHPALQQAMMNRPMPMGPYY